MREHGNDGARCEARDEIVGHDTNTARQALGGRNGPGFQNVENAKQHESEGIAEKRVKPIVEWSV
jgi:hypothetical protein